jgi:hypothetical protein
MYGVQAAMARMRSRALQTEGELAGTTGNGIGVEIVGWMLAVHWQVDQWGLQRVGGGMAGRC